MNFRLELAEAVMAGRKTVTRRLASENPRSPWWWQRCGLELGQDYAVCPGRGKPAIGRARVVGLRRETLDMVTNEEARREGFADVHAFGDAWRAINGRYEPDAIVWRVELEAIRP